MASVTKVEYCYTWKIENYSMCYRKYTEALRSPIFTPNNTGGSKWYLKFYPSGRKTKEFKACTLNRSDEDLGVEEISIAYKIEILNGAGSLTTTLGNDSSKYKFRKGTEIGWDQLTFGKGKEDHITIKCRIFSFLLAIGEAVTKVEIDRCSFSWRVDLNDCLDHGAVTRKFSFFKASQYEITVMLPNDKIEIKILKLGKSKTPRIISGKICLLNNLGDQVLSHFEKHLFDSLDDGNGTWNYHSFILKSALELEENKYMKNGKFSLFCEFSEANGNEESRTVGSDDSYFTTEINNIVTLHKELKDMYLHMKYSDVGLQAENVTLPAHKIFLSARSPVFSVMFDQDMVENRSDIVDITDIEVVTMKSFLEFIYTGNVIFQDGRSALKLLLAAEKYQVLSLKETCAEYLIPSLSVEDVCDVIVVADKVNQKKLKKGALDYIAKHITEISNSSEWLELLKTHTELSAEIFSYIATHFELKPREN
ncbi:speckle-type POZ protein-like isoform X2 [Parasteatoda tepidariorum]|uniref:speckle-type POZ protein-like isoform X2 n=1 Tax=Parasteatoda tepidariorum TaxID=114398 RepID=UPI001C71A39C|nr:speckle-type POZ protein-like isoform X2 [Parasteatoda tepidariorum]